MYMAVIFESLLFGDNAFFYRPIQILYFGFFLSAFAWASFRSVGVIAGLALLFLVANGDYWGNVWTNSLLPSEQIACLGQLLHQPVVKLQTLDAHRDIADQRSAVRGITSLP